ncbi:hypothetical protein [Leucothrix mucor]|uniref:hypothetical protein n=1 Tax=Leucothrix mucor TaxID=45248 RepID=UPI0003B54F03|nr:hypothetical protein [Leucothrix mucor]
MSTHFEPDKHSKTVEIPVRVKKGNKIEFFYDGELPNIQEGVLCRLIVPAYGITEQNQQQLSAEKTVSLLPEGSKIFMAIKIDRPEKVDAELLRRHKMISEQHRSEIKNRSSKVILQNGPVEIILLGDLKLTLRGTKRAKLESCRCKIPLLDIEAGSLNQAYSLISQEFEKHRMSHTGSVFRSMYYFDQQRSYCIGLDALREASEADDERERFVSASKKNGALSELQE